MPAGRPPFYDNVEDLSKSIEDYFESIAAKWVDMPVDDNDSEDEEEDEKKPSKPGKYLIPSRPATITGLAYHLGFTSRQALINYEEKPEFVDTIKRAKLRIEMAYEESIHGKNAAGPIFALKNFGWTDRQEVDQKTELSGSLSYTGINIIQPRAEDSKDV